MLLLRPCPLGDVAEFNTMVKPKQSVASLAMLDYALFLQKIKRDIAASRQRSALSVNAQLIQVYWCIGKEVLQRQAANVWVAKVIDRLAQDSKAAFPEMRGWSARNIKYMKFFVQHCPNGLTGQQAADQLPWFHIVVLLTQLSDAIEREWYALQTMQNVWFKMFRDGRNQATAFKPEHAVQLNFYLGEVDAQIKAPDDKSTIGLLLCKTQNCLVAEYALSGITNPMGVAEYESLRDFPESLGKYLQSIEDIEDIEAELHQQRFNMKTQIVKE